MNTYDPNAYPQQVTEHAIAPVQDRLLAFTLDFLLFVPLCSLLLSGVIKNTEYLYKVAPTSLEFVIHFAVVTVLYLFFATAFQTVCYILWQKTPGQYFLKLRVHDISGSQHRIAGTRWFLRSFLFTFQIPLLLPLLEILSHPLRRALHDRASDMIVVTLKSEKDFGPHPLESALVRQVLLVAFALIGFWSLAGVGYVYKLASSGEFKKKELIESQYLCKSMSHFVSSKDNRLDHAITLFLADRISEECLAAEADFAFWKPGHGEQDWAYLAKAFVNKENEKLFRSYLEESCKQKQSSAPCKISQQLLRTESSSIEGLEQSLTGSFLSFEYLISQGNWKKAEKISKNLMAAKGLQSFVLDRLIKIEWQKERREQAVAMSDVAQVFADEEQKIETSAWLCFEQLENGCQSELKACDQFANNLEEATQPLQSNMAGVALIELHRCRPKMEISANLLYQLRASKRPFVQYEQVRSAVSQSKASEKSGLAELVQTKSYNGYIKYAASINWIPLVNHISELDQFVESLASMKLPSYQTYKLVLKATDKAIELGFAQRALEYTKLVPTNFLNHKQYNQTVAKALEGLNQLDKADSYKQRSPAQFERESGL